MFTRPRAGRSAKFFFFQRPWLSYVSPMDKRKRGSPLFSFCGRKEEEGSSGGEREVLQGEAGQDEDLFGDEDDELFSRISEDSCL